MNAREMFDFTADELLKIIELRTKQQEFDLLKLISVTICKILERLKCA